MTHPSLLVLSACVAHTRSVVLPSGVVHPLSMVLTMRLAHTDDVVLARHVVVGVAGSGLGKSPTPGQCF